MKAARTPLAAIAIGLSAIALFAPAQAKVPTEHEPVEVLTGPTCDLAGYKTETRSVSLAIPDDDPVGVRTPFMTTAVEDSAFADIILELRMDHTWMGDLIVVLRYDLNCDGTPDTSATILCRPNRATCSGGSGFGCNRDLSCANAYRFSDEATCPLGVTASGCHGCPFTPELLPGGCFRTSGAGASPLSAFAGRLKGGCFYLDLSDNSGLDTGSLCEWSVHMKNQPPVSVRAATWGRVKAIYR